MKIGSRHFNIKAEHISVFLSLAAFVVASVFLFIYASGSGKQTAQKLFPKFLTGLAVDVRDSLKDLRYVNLAFASEDLPRYNINISNDQLDKLKNSIPDLASRMSEPSYVEGVDDRIRDENRIFADAVFEYGDQVKDIEVRYRGNGPPHWTFPKKSLRVRFPEDDLFNGKKDINLIIPLDRRYLVEEINNIRARSMGLIVPDSRFVVVTINGKDPALYWEVEHFGKEFLESKGISGDINLYGEGDTFQQHLYTDENYWQKYTANPNYNKADASELNKLLSLLNDSGDEEFNKNIFSILDKDNFYLWTIQNLLSGSWHQDYSHNIRAYYDTSLGKFKIIPWDVYLYPGDSLVEKDPLGLEATANPLVDRILSNPEFMQERNERLWSYLEDEENINSLLAEYDNLFESTKVAFYKDPLKRHSYSFFLNEVRAARAELKNNFLRLRELYLSPKTSFILENRVDSDEYGLELANFQSTAPVYIDEVEIEFKEGTEPVAFDLLKDGQVVCPLDKAIIKDLEVKISCSRVDLSPKLIKFDRTPDVVNHYIFNIFRLVKNKHNFVLRPQKKLDIGSIEKINVTTKNSFTKKKAESAGGITVDNNEFKNFSEISKTPLEFVLVNPSFRLTDDGLLLPKGIYTFSKNIIVPRNTKLTIAIGVQINLVNDASFVSYSPVVAIGAGADPIIVRGEGDGAGENFVVLDNNGLSIFENVKFSGGGQSFVNGAYFSGMLAIHHAESIVRNSTFENAQGDDALNIKYTSSTVEYNFFHNNSADAIDYDFSDGKIQHNKFLNNGNDGIDVSGSPVLIRFNDIERSGDKCISVGEASTPVIYNNLFDGCFIGVESKDLSKAMVINNVFVNNKTAINAYKKKDIFGGGFVQVYNSIIWDNKNNVEADSLSEIKINNSLVEGGYGGAGNFDEEPSFVSKENRDFTNDAVTASIKFQSGGDIAKFREILGIDLDKIPVGLVEKITL